MLNPFTPASVRVCVSASLCPCSVPAQERRDGGGVGGEPRRKNHSSYELVKQRANGQRGLHWQEISSDNA